MHFLLLGATGRTGKLVVSEALSQGHTAVALVRNAAALSSKQGLTVVQGSPLVKDDISKCLVAAPGGARVDAAIITLNTVRASDSPFAAPLSPPRLLADSCANACAVLQEAGISRIVIMSTAGAGDSWQGLPWLSRAFMGWTNIKYALADHNLVEEKVRRTGMDWTLVRPVKLDYEAEKDSGSLEELGQVGKGVRVSDTANTARVARFLIETAVQGRFIKSAVVIRDAA
ncbi:uncharacterized protein B0I36DRAFT_255572 [Microdochium trichocladiopsis]|uniref:NAD(P)-binding domain-containing protein n=1 Tax=Microdochium trichocladiopsis TaxID=1682393 RepID=A0A9P8XVP7_9PEZI|nr:uncharacterized protein B0I36DRAFT_255572 [Microdochium trichocladiopsis]KAH7014608.1 hypothetical protein B0I36DRAFT_255572 [Microdochium trichocladiopsis]